MNIRKNYSDTPFQETLLKGTIVWKTNSFLYISCIYIYIIIYIYRFRFGLYSPRTIVLPSHTVMPLYKVALARELNNFRKISPRFWPRFSPFIAAISGKSCRLDHLQVIDPGSPSRGSCLRSNQAAWSHLRRSLRGPGWIQKKLICSDQLPIKWYIYSWLNW